MVRTTLIKFAIITILILSPTFSFATDWRELETIVNYDTGKSDYIHKLDALVSDITTSGTITGAIVIATNYASSPTVYFNNATSTSGTAPNFSAGLTAGTLSLSSGSITDSSGAISFSNENLTTTGTLGAGAITGTSFIIGANTLDTTEWATLDGANSTQFTYLLAGQFLDVLTDPKLLLGWLTPSDAGTEQDLSPANHDATYVDASDWTTSDQLHKGFVWSLDFDGTDDYLSLGDHADFTFGNSLVDVPFSVGGWVEVVGGTDYQQIIGKWDTEWFLGLNSTEKINIWLKDESVAKYIHRDSDSIISAGWHFIVATYDGTGGATAMNGVTIYVDGVSVASTAFNDVGYVAMEDTATALTIGAAVTGGPFYFQGDMGMVFITKEQLTANDIWKTYVKTRGYYGL